MAIINGTTAALQILDEHFAVHVADLFRAFSDTSRARIMSILVNSEVNVGVLAKMVGMSDSSTSHHLRWLRQMRMVTARRSGKEVYYHVEDTHLIALFKQGVEHIMLEQRGMK
jgi:ArsR family transcriptional regulator, lead/cadmium/zinc/bismuth-responsive transcriptional repressor